jgi:hypothetical protein
VTNPKVLLAEQGEFKLGVPPQGFLADLGGQFGGDLAGRIKALLSRPGLVELPQLSRLSDVTFPGDNLVPGYYVEGFSEAWDHVAATWKTGSPGMIVGDGTRTRVRAGRSEPRHPLAAPTLARPRRDPGARTAKRRSEKGIEQAAPRHATAPSTRAATQRPQQRPTGESPQ